MSKKEETNNIKEVIAPIGMIFGLFLFFWGGSAYLNYLYEEAVDAGKLAKVIYNEHYYADLEYSDYFLEQNDFIKEELGITFQEKIKIESGFYLSYKLNKGNERFCRILNEKTNKHFISTITKCNKKQVDIYIKNKTIYYK